MIVTRQPPDRRLPACAGFTLIELMVVVAMIGLAVGIVVPNLGVLIPSARLDGAANQLRYNIDFLRSEARIQGKRMILELDLDKARWRNVLPPEERLTSDQAAETEESLLAGDWGWEEFETGVVIAGAGDARHGMADKDVYRIVFDEYGSTGDQVIVLGLDNDPQMVWSLQLSGLTGQVQLEKSEDGRVVHPEQVQEGNF